jgi:hypothetical protein
VRTAAPKVAVASINAEGVTRIVLQQVECSHGERAAITRLPVAGRSHLAQETSRPFGIPAANASPRHRQPNRVHGRTDLRQRGTKFHDTEQIKNGRQIAAALGFDMSKHWEPPERGFVGRMKKGAMVRALNEVGKSGEAERMAKMKTAAAAKATVEALKGTGLLPKTIKVA